MDTRRDQLTARADTVVLLTTWNRAALLRQSLPQITREAERIDAQLVISDDRSSDPETLRLLESARECGAEVLSAPAPPDGDRRRDDLVHIPVRNGLRKLSTSPEGARVIGNAARRGDGAEEARDALVQLWNRLRHETHLSAQRNNLFAFRHVLATYRSAMRILKVDDDVVLRDGAFEAMLRTWDQAEHDGHDVLAVSGIRTVNERLMRRFEGYGLTVGICNVAVLYRRCDWERLLERIPERVIMDHGFDLAFAWEYAPRCRRGSVAVCVSPSVVYHAGRNGVNVRDRDLNCEYGGDTRGIVAL